MIARDDDEIKSGTYPRREGTLGGGSWLVRPMEREMEGWISSRPMDKRWRGYFCASFSVSFRVKGGS